jgi:hypothetical protein
MASQVKLPKGFEPEQGEEALGTWKAAIPSGPSSAVAEHEGNLVLTSRRVVFVPANWSKWTRRIAARDRAAGDQPSHPLDRIHTVERGEGKLPRLRLEMSGQDPEVYLVSAPGINVNPRRRKNWAALDELIDGIRARIP